MPLSSDQVQSNIPLSGTNALIGSGLDYTQPSVNPSNASIPLQYNPIGASLPNPLATVTGVANAVSAMAGAKTAQATLAARQQAGQIIASAPDLPTAIKQLQGDPNVAGFLPEMGNMLQGQYQTSVATGGQIQSQAQTAAQGFMRTVTGALRQDGTADPVAAQAQLDQNLATVPAAARPAAEAALAPIRTALTEGLPTDPGAAAQEFGKRIIALGIAGGQPAPSTYSLAGTIPPTLTGQLGSQFLVGGSPAAGGAANALAARVPTPGATQPTAVLPDDPALAGAEAGKRYAAANLSYAPPETGGGPILTEGMAALNKGQLDEYTTVGPKVYGAAQQVQGMMQTMSNAGEQMAKTGGILAPGTFAQYGVGLAKAVNSIESAFPNLFPNGPTFDTGVVADAEGAIKATEQSSVSLTTALLGQQREAAQTLMNMHKAVPSIDNSALGLQFLAATNSAFAQRIIDERTFDNQYLQSTKGVLGGADVAFNAAKPMSGYVDKVLDQFGLNAKGFKNPAAIDSAYKQGLLTAAQAKSEYSNWKQAGGSAAAPAAATPGAPNALSVGQ
jgi:hypothetical protein